MSSNRNFILLATLLAAAVQAQGAVTSPDGKIVVETGLDSGRPYYEIKFNGKQVIAPSQLGLKSDEVDLSAFVSAREGSVTTSDTRWSPVWGEFESIRDHYNEMPLTLVTAKGDTLVVRFKVYDDGVGFRYEIPEQKGVNYMTVRDEMTRFNLTGDLTLFAIPGDYDTDERLYVTAPASRLGEKMRAAAHSEGSAIPGLAVQTPLLAKSSDGDLYMNIHEAALKGFPAMALEVDAAGRSLKAHLTPDRNGVRGYVQAPFSSPWRTLIIADNAPGILASQLILNLNEPSAIGDTSWIKPMKFVGVWWEMFLGGSTWAYSDKYNARPGETDYSALRPNGRHPGNTANAKKYIDFAAKNGIDAVLVEGWNEGWEDWTGWKKNHHFDFTKPYPDFDVKAVAEYAASKGVKMIMHHETSANAADYERQLDDALRYMNKYGYPAVKTGYVGHVIPRSEFHSSQWMVDHYLYVAKRAAEHRIMVDSHEAVRPTGMIRTYPNWVAQESARGGEFESMGGNPPEHTAILPFTRLKGGPMDYTPGLFEMNLESYGKGNVSKGLTTLARQLALYVTMPSPIQMACDLPENYERFDDAFQFIRDVPLDWSESIWLEAEPGDYITVARREKGGECWYIGGITDENARTAVMPLSFLPKGRKYVARIYHDAKDADYLKAPQKYGITVKTVDCKTKLKQYVAPGGGFAIQLTPKE